jgi:hypothetical protein
VLGFVEKTLNKDGSVAKGRFGFGSGSLEGVFQACLFPHDSHATSTASVCRLDDDWKTIFICEFLYVLELVNRSFGSRNNRYACLDRKSSGRDFVAKRVDNFGGGADKLELPKLVAGPRHLI